MRGLPGLTGILSCCFLLYICYALWTLSNLFNVAPCHKASTYCLRPIVNDGNLLQVWIYTSKSQTVRLSNVKSMTEVLRLETFDPTLEWQKTVDVATTLAARQNGSMYVHVFILPTSTTSISSAEWYVLQTAPLTKYELPEPDAFQLVGSSADNVNDDKINVNITAHSDNRPISHWQSELTLSIVTQYISFDTRKIPGEIVHFVKLYGKEYLPILFVGDVNNRIKHLVPLNESSTTMSLNVVYKPISVGTLRLWLTMMESFQSLRAVGFQSKDVDDMKGLLLDTSLYILMLTFLVAAFHLVFDFLAFKNDISYWKARNTMVGLSTRTVLWRSGSTFIVFLYLLDQQTSYLVLIPAGIGSIIEFWKVFKALKITIHWEGTLPSIRLGDISQQEKETEEIDTMAMGMLSYLLYPLCIAGAVYSLVYTPHKSWYSWCIKSLVNGVYAFGFLFMLPQLYINYRLKSVAHLPWKAFMYKAFNTFIDDVFAFIITMPTAHRLACFRDDIVFLIYLYQRWLYPVDMKRVNEFGQKFDKDNDNVKKRQ